MSDVKTNFAWELVGERSQRIHWHAAWCEGDGFVYIRLLYVVLDDICKTISTEGEYHFTSRSRKGIPIEIQDPSYLS